MYKKSFSICALLMGFLLLGTTVSSGLQAVTVQGGDMTREIFLGMTKEELILKVGAPSLIKSEGYCLQYETFDMSVFLDRDMRVERIYLGPNFHGLLGGDPGGRARADDVYKAFGNPQVVERLAYTPSSLLQAGATVETEYRPSSSDPQSTVFPLEYRGGRVLYELYGQGMVLKQKYVSDDDGIAVWMDDDGEVYATVLFPVGSARLGWAGKGHYLETVYFDFDRFNLGQHAKAALARNTDYLKKHPSLRATVEGHTDWMGTDAYNMKLGEKRAQAVANYLTQSGVPAARLKTESYGESRPAADNQSAEGRARNRRAELKAEETQQNTATR